nr:MAG TPA: hypothetical protein [Caudoviricetes sp.]DAW91125.1 MAG TPA: hypothetical protein [Caudoviricetes sp.]
MTRQSGGVSPAFTWSNPSCRRQRSRLSMELQLLCGSKALRTSLHWQEGCSWT